VLAWPEVDFVNFAVDHPEKEIPDLTTIPSDKPKKEALHMYL
jgi:hypothetical protein